MDAISGLLVTYHEILRVMQEVETTNRLVKELRNCFVHFKVALNKINSSTRREVVEEILDIFKQAKNFILCFQHQNWFNKWFWRRNSNRAGVKGLLDQMFRLNDILQTDMLAELERCQAEHRRFRSDVIERLDALRTDRKSMRAMQVEKKDIVRIKQELQRESLGDAPWVIPTRALVMQGEIGRGGFGVVQKALYKGMLVAVKESAVRFRSNKKALRELEQFRRELGLSVGLRHENVVRVYGGTLVPAVSIVMELCEMGSLDDVIADDDTFSIQSVHRLIWSRQLATGLYYMHSRGVLHHDIKSMNVLVDKNGVAKWTDFGLASRHSLSTFSHTHQVTGGTELWSPPEAFDGSYEAKSDVWGFGLVVYHLCEMKEPFVGVSRSALRDAIRERRLELNRTSKNGSGEPLLKEIIQKTVQVDRKKRPRAVDLWRTLHEGAPRVSTLEFLRLLDEGDEKNELPGMVNRVSSSAAQNGSDATSGRAAGALESDAAGAIRGPNGGDSLQRSGTLSKSGGKSDSGVAGDACASATMSRDGDGKGITKKECLRNGAKENPSTANAKPKTKVDPGGSTSEGEQSLSLRTKRLAVEVDGKDSSVEKSPDSKTRRSGISTDKNTSIEFIVHDEEQETDDEKLEADAKTLEADAKTLEADAKQRESEEKAKLAREAKKREARRKAKLARSRRARNMSREGYELMTMGVASTDRLNKGMTLMIQARELGSPLAKAQCFRHGWGGEERDLEKAASWYRTAAEDGEPIAQYRLAVCYDRGEGVGADPKEAVTWYRRAAEQGHTWAQCKLAYCLDVGRGIDASVSEAVKYYRMAAESGNASAQYNLGACYQHGRGVDVDMKAAVSWYRNAAGQGDVDAQTALGDCYRDGSGVAKSITEALRWYTKAGDAGHARALANAGICLVKSREFRKAVKNLRKAADAGDALGQYHLALCLENGDGVWRKDKKKSFELVTKSAEQGYAEAQASLAHQYSLGHGTERNLEKSIFWARKAALQGHAAAQHSLGYAYEFGEGAERNEGEALKWYRRAAAQGHGDAREKVEELARARQGQDAKEESALSSIVDPTTGERLCADGRIRRASLVGDRTAL